MIIHAIKNWARTSLTVQGAIQQLNLFKLRNFQSLSDDIFIVTYPRSGTTLMQMMLYQLTTNGSMEFEHIKKISPWLEMNPPSIERLKSMPRPRVFKTHLELKKAKRFNGKLLYVVRDGRDVALSYYHLHCGYFGFRGTFEEFFEEFMKGNIFYGSWFDHVAQWKSYSESSPVLFLKYEEIVASMNDAVRQVAQFCELKLEEADFNRTAERCHISFMKQYEEKFGPPKPKSTKSVSDESRSFIRKGKSGGWQESFTPEMKARFQEKLEKTLPGLYH